MACQVVLVVNNLTANAGGERDTAWIPALGKSTGVGSGNHSSILAWKTPWTEEPGGCSPWSCKELDVTEHAHNTF